ncbi:hypothetical protein KAU33_04660, partial [Candidatus Dependentiae bacterium]|nr:hypothetical protein [Candidatus Dependentiae bacterium]
ILTIFLSKHLIEYKTTNRKATQVISEMKADFNSKKIQELKSDKIFEEDLNELSDNLIKNKKLSKESIDIINSAFTKTYFEKYKQTILIPINGKYLLLMDNYADVRELKSDFSCIIDYEYINKAIIDNDNVQTSFFSYMVKSYVKVEVVLNQKDEIEAIFIVREQKIFKNIFSIIFRLY